MASTAIPWTGQCVMCGTCIRSGAWLLIMQVHRRSHPVVSAVEAHILSTFGLQPPAAPSIQIGEAIIGRDALNLEGCRSQVIPFVG
jgi:hypothetical protein